LAIPLSTQIFTKESYLITGNTNLVSKIAYHIFNTLEHQLSVFFIYVVKTSCDFLETPRFASMSFADASDFIKQADNAHRTVQSFSFP
jgi:hypothetical protein